MSLIKGPFWFLFFISFYSLFWTTLNIAGAQEGPAIVIDGDTLELSGERIRLHGIDSPEIDQVCKSGALDYSCGVSARNFLVHLIQGKTISCEGKDVDRYGRTIGICMLDNLNINGAMVVNGWAIAYRYYSNDYVPEEDSAKENRRGIWRGDFITPYNWRRGIRWPN